MSRRDSTTWTTHWTGPDEEELEVDGTTLKRPVSGDRWPFGPREAHEDCCNLHKGGLFCDCLASDASAED
jgi:hypothetical protein